MRRAMPRVTPLRVLLLLPCVYLLMVVLWLCLPFPLNAIGTNNEYQQKVLRRGQVLTTVHRSECADSPVFFLRDS